MTYHLPYESGGGIQPMEGEVRLNDTIMLRIDLIARKAQATTREELEQILREAQEHGFKWIANDVLKQLRKL